MLKRVFNTQYVNTIIFAVVTALTLAIALLFYTIFEFTNPSPAQAQSTSSDLLVQVDSVLELSLNSCNSTNNSVVEVNIEPTSAGTFKSNCQDVTVNTNAPGYTLTAKSSTSTMNYQNPTTITPTPTIASTSNSLLTPSTLSNDTWGFAVQDRLNFNSTYTIDNSNNTYASLPTSDTTIYSTTEFPLPETDHTFYYAARLTPATMAGSYATTVTYTAVPNEVPLPLTYCGTTDYECIIFTVDVGDTGTYSIPTSGYTSGSSNHTYDWSVYVDDVLTTGCPDGNCTGASANASDGIVLTNLTNGTHQIRITPNHGDALNSTAGSVAGWGNAFSYFNTTTGANTAENKQKLITLDAPLTTMAFAPKTTESTTNASGMFYGLFYNCSNLTTPMKVLDTYTLPDTINNFTSFMYYTHTGNSKLAEPVDLTPLTGWLNANNSITNMRGFLSGTHYANTNLVEPMNLTPVAGWFNSNTSITNLSNFLSNTHQSNSQLQDPIDLTPLENWFAPNRSMATLTGFMSQAHYNNLNLNLSGQKILPSWAKTITSGGANIWNVGASTTEYTFYRTFYASSAVFGDTAEIKFIDGATLSSVGEPSAGRQTYYNRNGITPENNSWK